MTGWHTWAAVLWRAAESAEPQDESWGRKEVTAMHELLASSSGAFASGALVFAVVILGSAWTALWIWLATVAVQYLRLGAKAFRRYLLVTEQQRPPAPEPLGGQGSH